MIIKENIQIELHNIQILDNFCNFESKIYRNGKLKNHTHHRFENLNFYSEDDLKNGKALEEVINTLKYSDLL